MCISYQSDKNITINLDIALEQVLEGISGRNKTTLVKTNTLVLCSSLSN